MYSAVIAGYDAKNSMEPLSYAESDAHAFDEFLGSGIGPGKLARRTLLVDGLATEDAIAQAIADTRFHGSSFLLFYFSGHGNDDGLLTDSGLLHFSDLIDLIQFTGIDSTMVILDTCGSGSYAGHIKEASIEGYGEALFSGWVELLSQATPGTRLMLSTGPGRSSIESAEAGGGHFTQTLLYVLRKHYGDLDWQDHSWISDQFAFGGTARIMARRYGKKQIPVELGITGDFPMAVSQRGEPLGDAEFGISRLGLLPRRGAMKLDLVLHLRKGLTTKVVQEVSALNGKIAYRQEQSVKPGFEHTRYQLELTFPIQRLLDMPVCRLQRRALGRVRFNWDISLYDEQNQLIDFKVVNAFWHDGR